MNSVYNHILLQNLKNLPKHGQSKQEKLDAKYKKAFESYLNERALNKQISILEVLQRRTEDMIKSVTVLEARALGLQKSFNLTTDVSREQAIELDKVAIALKINARLSKQYAADMAKFMPGQIKNITANEEYNEELQLTNDFLRNRLGLDAQQAFSIRKIANLQKKSVAEVIRDAEKTNKKLIEEEGYAGGIVDILSEMANLNSDIAIQYGRGIPGQLEKSVIAAKKFGLTLGDLNKTAGAMLDIESATTSAVEYQVFTGKKLEGQKYKNVAAAYNQATIEGDSEKQMDIMIDLIQTQGEHLKTNYKSRETAAKFLNIETSQITDMLSMMEEYDKLGQMNVEVEQLEGESDEDFAKRKAETIEERKGTAKGVDGILDGTDGMTVEQYIKDLSEKRSTQTSIQKVDDTQEIRKAKMSVKANKNAYSSADVVDTANKLMDELAAGLTAEGGIVEFAIGTATIVADILNLADTSGDLVDALKNKDEGFNSETPDINVDQTKNDAFIRVNDTILFDPNDKINTMASTSQGSLDKTTANMAGGSSNNTSNIGQQVATAIAGMSFVVNNSFNGEEIITAMEIIQGNKMNA